MKKKVLITVLCMVMAISGISTGCSNKTENLIITVRRSTYPDGTAKSRTSRPEDYIKRIFACRKRQGNTGGRKAE